MDPFVLSRIDALVEVNKQWVTEFLPIEVQVVGEDEVQVLGEDEVQVSDSDESIRIVNLADFIGTGMHSNRDDNCKHLRQYLPRRFNSNSPSSQKEQVIPFIAAANKESICPFAFSLYWEPNDGLEDNVAGRWYF